MMWQFKDVPGYEDGCYNTFSGLWGWNGRYGYITFNFTDPFSGDPSEPIVRQLSNAELTSDIIKAVLEN